jgi:ABC-type nitrate/sulfonate/bicarbonate transport system permease component
VNHRALRLTGNVLLGLALPVALLVLWEVAANRDWINTLFYPAPSVVLQRSWDQIRDGNVLRDAQATSKRLALGFLFGATPAIFVGLAAGLIRPIRTALYPLATALYVVPRIAMLPLVLVAFSIGDPARVFMVAFSVFFIVFFSALAGAEQVDHTHLDVARAFGAGRVRQIMTVLLPGALPALMSGLQVAMGFALIVIIGTEFMAANDGLGARIWRSYQIFDFPSMYAGVMAVTVLGVLINAGLLAVTRVLLPWRRS